MNAAVSEINAQRIFCVVAKKKDEEVEKVKKRRLEAEKCGEGRQKAFKILIEY